MKMSQSESGKRKLPVSSIFGRQKKLESIPLFFFSAIILGFSLGVAAEELPGDDGGWLQHAAVGKGKTRHCPVKTPVSRVRQIATRVFGGAQAKCYMHLCNLESGCQPTCYQKKGKGKRGNPAAGYGLCSLERSKKRRAKRGPDCNANLNGATEAGIERQLRCCQYIMKHTPSYFGPLNKGIQSKCS